MRGRVVDYDVDEDRQRLVAFPALDLYHDRIFFKLQRRISEARNSIVIHVNCESNHFVIVDIVVVGPVQFDQSFLNPCLEVLIRIHVKTPQAINSFSEPDFERCSLVNIILDCEKEAVDVIELLSGHA